MIINSPYRDYYDGMQRYDEEAFKYQRQIIGFDIPDGFMKSFASKIFDVYIGFCGKIYPMIKFRHGDAGKQSIHYCNTLSRIDELTNEHLNEKEIDQYYKGNDGWFYSVNTVFKRSDITDVIKRSNLTDQFVFDCDPNIFMENKCPIFAIAWGNELGNLGGINNDELCIKITKQEKNPDFGKANSPLRFNTHMPINYDKWYAWTNPKLNDFDFYRVFDPYQTFQEIEMYMNNMAFPNKPIPEIDNKTMIEIKGFDKFSFRKEPSKKKRK